MTKTRKGWLALGGLVLLGLSLLRLISNQGFVVSPPELTAPTEATNPGATTISPATVTPTAQTTPTANPPTATPLPADPTPTLPPVAPREGFTAPDFSLTDLQGNVITLSQFRGQPVLVNFWTTWCPYCREEVAALEEIHRRYADQGLVVLAMNVQEKVETVAPFVQSEGLTFPILLDSDASTVRAYSTIAIPTSFFIDRRGVVSFIRVGPLTGEDVDSYLAILLN
jgi:cytochrome c biogenesis protein CcmG/thiol:disulfide interchange protein DsbE